MTLARRAKSEVAGLIKLCDYLQHQPVFCVRRFHVRVRGSEDAKKEIIYARLRIRKRQDRRSG